MLAYTQLYRVSTLTGTAEERKQATYWVFIQTLERKHMYTWAVIKGNTGDMDLENSGSYSASVA